MAMMVGAGLGNMTENFLAVSIVQGMNTTVDTLVSSAFGAGDKKLCSVYLTRGRFILCFMYIPITLLLINIETLLVSLGQDKEASKYAAQYMLAYLPGLYLQGFSDLHRRYLNCMGYSKMPFICLIIGTVFHYFISYHLVIELQMGIYGTGLACLSMNVVIFILQHAYASLFMPEIEETLKFPGFSCINMEGILSYLKLGIPSTFLICIDWWAFELLLIICGLFGVAQ